MYTLPDQEPPALELIFQLVEPVTSILFPYESKAEAVKVTGEPAETEEVSGFIEIPTEAA